MGFGLGERHQAEVIKLQKQWLHLHCPNIFARIDNSKCNHCCLSADNTTESYPVPKTATAVSIADAFRIILRKNGFKPDEDNLKFEKKRGDFRLSIKIQDANARSITIKVKTENKLRDKKTETLFHHVSNLEVLETIIDSIPLFSH